MEYIKLDISAKFHDHRSNNNKVIMKHHVIEWLSWLPNNSGSINYNVLETLKDRPSTPTSLKILQHRVHGLVGGPLNPFQQSCGEEKA